MKTFKLLFLIVVFASLIVGCSKDELTPNNEDLLKSAQPISVTVPFEAHMLGTPILIDFENAECAQEGYPVHVMVEAEGTATHMGKVSVTFEFCAGGQDPNLEAPHMTVGANSCVLIAANGDELFLSTEGGAVVIGRTDEHPDYVIDYWKYPYTITGGTGNFDGAEGIIYSDDYDTDLDEHSVHNWYGEITLVKGKR
ncbi:hypothetical protein SLH46_12785 [Draconibacterium sp. IB214405]|uniref:hypothetical protein n=1 Tax=Draconibacterium sp. IB214405 TaxID=3097352 RepID=UPI002A1728F5|nr:hypothetical protein [Draconibacterium sp. IB214405]MDX8340069.1 hypothetical protein [Draconibacterium sp. IB214405]